MQYNGWKEGMDIDISNLGGKLDDGLLSMLVPIHFPYIYLC